MLRPVHTTHHRGIVHDANFDCLENIVWTCEALKPDDSLELDVSSFVEFMKRFQYEIARIRLLQRIVCSRRVFSHAGYASYPERDSEECEDSFAQICQCLGGVGGVVVQHGDEYVGGTKTLGQLDYNGKLIDEEVVRRMDDHANKVEVILAG